MDTKNENAMNTVAQAVEDTVVDPTGLLSTRVRCLVFTEILEEDCHHAPLTNYLPDAISQFGIGARGPFTTYQVVNAEMMRPYVIIGHGIRFLRNQRVWGTSEISIEHMEKKPRLGDFHFGNHQELKSRFPFLEVSAEMETTGHLFFIEMEVRCDAIRTAVDEKSRQEIISRVITRPEDNGIDGELAITKTLGTLQSKSSVRITVITKQHPSHMMQTSSILCTDYHRRFQSRLDALFPSSLNSRIFLTRSVPDRSEWSFKPGQPKVQFWGSLDHRTATLGIGEMCEQMAHSQAHDELRKKKVGVIPFIIPDMVDKESGCPTAFLLAVNKANSVRPELLPRNQERCKVTMQYRPPTPDPTDDTSDEQFVHLVSNHIVKFWGKAFDTGLKYSERMGLVAANFAEIAKDPSDDVVMKWTVSTQQDSEKECSIAWIERISQFVQAEKDNLKLPVPDMANPKWSAFAIPVPEKLAHLTHCVLFAYVPSLPGSCGTNQRVFYDYRKMPYLDARKDLGSPNAHVPGSVRQDVHIDIEDHSETTEARIWALNKLGNVRDHPRVSEWLLQFQNNADIHNFAETFPAAGVLASHLKQGTAPTDPNLSYIYKRMEAYDEHQITATLKLYKPLPYGHWVCTGYPGSGKSAVTLLAALPMFLQKVDFEDLDGIIRYNPSPAPASKVAYRRTPISSNQRRPDPGSTGDESPAWFFDEPIRSQSEIPVFESSTPERFLPRTRRLANTPQLIIMCAQNGQADEVCREVRRTFEALTVPLKVCRLHTMSREVSSLRGETHGTLEAKRRTNFVDAVLLDSVLANAMGETCIKPERRADHQDSLSAMIWAMIQTNPEFEHVKELIGDRMENPYSFEDNREMVEEHIHAASLEVVRSVDCFIGTSTAVQQLGTRFGKDLRVTTIILEESGRMTEAESSIAHAFSPTVKYWLFNGDPKQITPMNFASSELDPVRKQMDCSFLERVSNACPQVVSFLPIGYRSYGNLHKPSSVMIYGDNFRSANRALPEGVKVIWNWAHTTVNSRVRGNAMKGGVMVVRVDGEEMEDSKKSWVNVGHGRVIREFVANIHKANLPAAQDTSRRASVCVLSPYAAQTIVHRKEIAKLAPNEICPEVTDLMTVTKSVGITRDIVILDMVRSSEGGFGFHPPQFNVGMTRARALTIVVMGNQSGNQSAGWLLKFAKEAQATFYIPKTNVPGDCWRCYKPHKGKKHECTNPNPICSGCGGQHHIRRCHMPSPYLSAQLSNPED